MAPRAATADVGRDADGIRTAGGCSVLSSWKRDGILEEDGSSCAESSNNKLFPGVFCFIIYMSFQ